MVDPHWGSISTLSLRRSAKREFEDEEKERGKAGRIHCGVGSVEGREDDLFADLLDKGIYHAKGEKSNPFP